MDKSQYKKRKKQLIWAYFSCRMPRSSI